ncbi:hypothetical protein IU433_14385 [Nocardia puris]|uniref:DUF8020 domain-containing protein n=1 Tax=Nocardia puris TaxID=208602 RepID=A0A366DD03_9NOCA|nr:hypothetical protein [Nocardia puris]MBF6214940.1 hypothetical protein [Nocardia puris]MBF6364784.1 hypothetical protein [Nocardia puris]MBF6460225.1 hypothetical protein [Nocardia puris]RBO87931.1 hypothetical protein DFR74_110186 [Nocardia puris]
MNFRRTTAAAALVIGALTVGMGTAHAEPAAPAPAEDISYSVKLVDKTVVASLRGGTFSLVEKDGATVDDPKTNILDIKDDAGNTVISLPLSFNVNGTDIPVATEVKKDGTVLEVTPEKPEGVQLDKPVEVKPIAGPIENQRAMNDFASKFGIGTAIGGFVGTAIGAVVGCVFGLPLFGVGCIAGLPIGAGIGGILGTIAVGGPTLLAAGIELINTLQAPEGTTQWADKPKAAQAAN